MASSKTRVSLALQFIAALQGAAVLIIEILGARMLTPYFGTSHYVWSAQICVTLLALTFGYALGARYGAGARRGFLVRIALAAAAAYCACTPFWVERISYASYRLSLPAGAMVTSLALFAVPLAALAAVSPCLVGEATKNGENTTSVAGRMAAVSTGGSVIGVLLVAYLCIPYLPSSTSMYGLAVVLALASFAGIPEQRIGKVWSAVSLLLTGAALGSAMKTSTPPHTRRYQEIDRAYSAYSTLQVWQSLTTPVRSLSTNLAFQNYYDTVRRQSTDVFAYALATLTKHHVRREGARALIVGLGIGVVPRLLAAEGFRSEVFEIDPEIPALAARHFDADLAAFTIRIGDGRQLLKQVTEPADVLILDAFHGDSTPSHLLSQEAFESMRSCLTRDGVVIGNLATDPDQENLLLPIVVNTLHTVFTEVRVYDAKLGNVFVVASMRPLDVSTPIIPDMDVPQAVLEDLRRVLAAGREPLRSSGRVLRDDFNPADALVAKVAESERRIAASAARSQ